LTGEWIDKNLYLDDNYFGIYSQFFQSPYGLLIGGYHDSWQGPLQIFTQDGIWQPFIVEINGAKTHPYLYAGNDVIQYIAESKRIGASYNAGHDWHWLPSLEDEVEIRDLILIDDKLFVIPVDQTDSLPKLYVSDTQGNSWEMADEGIISGEVQTVIEAEDYLLTYTRGENSSVYYSRKDLIQWHTFNEGLPAFQVRDIVFDGRDLYVSMNGRGVYRRNVQDLLSTTTKDLVKPHGFYISPNPVTDHQVRIVLPETGNCKLTLYNFVGQPLEYWELNGDNSPIDLNLPLEMIPGMYVFTLVAGNNVWTGKIVVQ
jgi:hypothetical protein